MLVLVRRVSRAMLLPGRGCRRRSDELIEATMTLRRWRRRESRALPMMLGMGEVGSCKCCHSPLVGVLDHRIRGLVVKQSSWTA